jgi:uncharacterized protein YjbJ (UPF0337 family)
MMIVNRVYPACTRALHYVKINNQIINFLHRNYSEFHFKLFKENFMDKDIIKGKWHEIKGSLKVQWGKLTDDQITQMKGSYEELAGALQKSYGYQKDQAKKEIDAFINKSKFKE